MLQARYLVLVALGLAGMFPPVLNVVDAYGNAAVWLFGLWAVLIVGAALLAQRH
nr:hypothetical protein [Oceanococcus sp. HetDA_MAG_MS8]